LGSHRVILRTTGKSIEREQRDHRSQPCQLATARPDLLRWVLSTFIEALTSAEADAVCGAGYGERSEQRTNRRNGYRHRDFDTRVGTMNVAVPQAALGELFPGLAADPSRAS
jgi:transposase-like protein